MVPALTLRGLCFLTAGLTAAVGGVLVGEADYIAIGVLLALPPLISLVGLSRHPHDLSVRRLPDATRVRPEQDLGVQLQVGNTGLGSTSIRVTDALPTGFGTPLTARLDALRPGTTRSVDCRLRPRARGRYALGPTLVERSDVFGLVTARHQIGTTTPVTVLPHVEPLPTLALPGLSLRNATGEPVGGHVLPSGGVPDATLREYVPGDEPRRIHWRTYARTGTLMVRREEALDDLRCVLYLDNLATAHPHHRSVRPAASTFEAAVSATASVLTHLSRTGHRVDLVDAGGPLPTARIGSPDAATPPRIDDAMEGLAIVDLQDSTPPTGPRTMPGTSEVTRAGADIGAVVAVLGPGSRVADLTALSGRHRYRYAIVTTVVGGGAERAGELLAGELRRSGWTATVWTAPEPLAHAWRRLLS